MSAWFSTCWQKDVERKAKRRTLVGAEDLEQERDMTLFGLLPVKRRFKVFGSPKLLLLILEVDRQQLIRSVDLGRVGRVRAHPQLDPGCQP